MLKPKALKEFLEKTHKTFKDIKNIFIAKADGSLIACTNLGQDEKNFTACLSNIWTDFYDIGKLKLGNEDNYQGLQYALIEHEKGKAIITLMNEQYILGIDSENIENVGILIQKMNLIKKYLESQFKLIVEDQDN